MNEILSICEHYPAPAMDTALNFLSTHDTERALTVIADEPANGRGREWQSGRCVTGDAYEEGMLKLRMAYAIIYTLPGVPCLYYGDEIGMRYVEGLTSVEGGFGRTGSRSPMQWDSGLNVGFSSARPDMLYIPQDPSPDRPDAASQSADENSLRSEVKRIIAVRMANPALQSNGKIEFISDGYPLVYKRTAGAQSIAVIINPSAQEAVVPDIAGRLVYSIGSAEVKENSTVT